MKKLEAHNIFPYSLHDCLVVKKSQVKRVILTMSSEFCLLHGITPALKTSFVDQTFEDDDNYYEEIEGTNRTHIDNNYHLSYVSGMFPNQTN